MDKEKILDYVMNSPYNSNRAVLSSMLEEGSEDVPKELHLYYNSSTDVYEIDEAERHLIDEAKTQFNAEYLNIYVFDGQAVFLGKLKTEYKEAGRPTGFLYASVGVAQYTSGAYDAPNHLSCSLTIYRIDSSNYSAKKYSKTSGITIDLE